MVFIHQDHLVLPAELEQVHAIILHIQQDVFLQVIIYLDQNVFKYQQELNQPDIQPLQLVLLILIQVMY